MTNNAPPPTSIQAPLLPLRPGLSAQVAAQRLAEEGPNLLPDNAPKTALAILRDVLTEPMFVLLLAAGGIYLALGDRAEALFLLSFVFVVMGITLVQERRTQRALESLRDLSAPRAWVQRDGQAQRISSADVVRGDLLLLREGDRIAADAHVIAGRLSVNESLLTGEAVPVNKRPDPTPTPSTTSPSTRTMGAPGGDHTPDLFASTVVTQGSAWAEVQATGSATVVGQIGVALRATTEPTSRLQLDSRRWICRLGLGAIITAGLLVLIGWWWDERPLLDALLSGIALAMAILPEEIPVILTVFLALGAWRIAQQQVLTRRISAVESLGAITVLAVDKTGTLTQNRMAVAELVTEHGHCLVSDLDTSTLPEEFHHLVEFAMLATPPDAFDPMEQAIQLFGHTHLTGTEHVHDGRPIEFEYPLSPDILAMTRIYAEPPVADQIHQHLLATKGAPEAIADLCHMPADQREQIRRQVESCAERGLRVLGVARGRWPRPSSASTASSTSPGSASSSLLTTATPTDQVVAPWPANQHDFDFTFLGLIALADPPRPEVAAAMTQCHEAGIRVLMMTGDHPATACAIAQQVGLSDRPGVLTGKDIDALTDLELRERLRHSDIGARLQPLHKLRLVQVLREAGEVVAMTGDGVNDAPALKAADVGIAMGERGTDVAREAASIVLLNDSFANIVAAIRQGRRIYDNIVKATRFTIAVHIPIVAMAMVPALLHWPLLLWPVHIVLLELLIDPACSVVFEAEPEARNNMRRPPRSPNTSPFASANLRWGLWQGLGLALILMIGHLVMTHAGVGPEHTRTSLFIALVLGVLLLTVLNCDRPPGGPLTTTNPWLIRMATLMATMLTLIMVIPPLRHIMALVDLTLSSSLGILLMVLLSTAWLIGVRLLYARPARA